MYIRMCLWITCIGTCLVYMLHAITPSPPWQLTPMFPPLNVTWLHSDVHKHRDPQLWDSQFSMPQAPALLNRSPWPSQYKLAAPPGKHSNWCILWVDWSAYVYIYSMCVSQWCAWSVYLCVCYVVFVSIHRIGWILECLSTHLLAPCKCLHARLC